MGFLILSTLLAWSFGAVAHAQAPQGDDFNNLAQRVLQFMGQGKTAEALESAQALVTLAQSKFGPDDPSTGWALGILGVTCMNAGQLTRAEPLLTKALAICSRKLGRLDPSTILVASELGSLWRKMGALSQAEGHLKSALQECERALGAKHRSCAVLLGPLADVYLAMGNRPLEIACRERVVEIKDTTSERDQLSAGMALYQLAQALAATGNHSRALQFFERALMLFEARLGPNNRAIVEFIPAIAVSAQFNQDYPRARALYDRAIKILEATVGPQHPEVASLLVMQARYYTITGDRASARAALERALRIQETSLGKDHPVTAQTLIDLSYCCMFLGDISQTDQYLRRAIPILERALADHGRYGLNEDAVALQLGIAYHCLADFCFIRGNWPASKEVMGRLRTLCKEHPSLGDLQLQVDARDSFFNDAPEVKLVTLERNLALARKNYGTNNSVTIALTSELALTNLYAGHKQVALTIAASASRNLRSALQSEWTLGPIIAANLSQVFCQTGKHLEGTKILEETLDFCKQKDPARQEIQLYSILYYTLAKHLTTSNRDKAISYQDEASEIEDKMLVRLFSFTSTSERLSIGATRRPYDVYATLGDANRVALTTLRRKGIVLDATLDDLAIARATRNTETARKVAQLRALRSAARSSEALPSAELNKQAEELERAIARETGGRQGVLRALQVTPAMVQAALPEDTTLVEYVLYSHLQVDGKSEDRYGAVVLSSQRQPQWVALGSAVAIDARVQTFQSEMRIEPTPDHDRRLAELLRDLHERLWAPVSLAVPTSTRRVIVCADGLLHFVSFATLLNRQGQFLVETMQVVYVDSGRDLIRTTKAPSSRELVIVADPAFSDEGVKLSVSSESSQGVAGEPVRLPLSTGTGGLKFVRLPGTAREAEAVRELAAQAGVKSQVYLREAATKSRVTELLPPRWLHLATHGFFLPANGPHSGGLNSAGLALAGAQVTIDNWQKGISVPESVDGLLTAEEIAFLTLNGTDLVVLSACDTGMGNLVPGEGVLGLKRAFVQAGAKNLLITLWPILDGSTSGFMRDFYQEMLSGSTPPTALAIVQRKWLTTIRAKEGLHRAVVTAGPFVMSIQGALGKQ